MPEFYIVPEFPFLIGKLQTLPWYVKKSGLYRFPFLIGKLQTWIGKPVRLELFQVSIPHR